ncbi:MAG: hypothetical protein ACC742_09835 [Thermoanaerobaculales bacterium]
MRLLPPAVCGLMILAGPAIAGESAPPNFVPILSLSYVDPQSGERIACEDGCRRFSVPAGIELELKVMIENTGGAPDGDGVPWDLWLDQRKHPFPGLDIAACRDEENGPVDPGCWRALVGRVKWDSWKRLEADRVCVPETAEECEQVTVKVLMDPDFAGSRGRGVYSFAVWVDRFRVTTESDEFDNFAGPVRVKVLPPSETAIGDRPETQNPSDGTVTDGDPARVEPAAPGSSPMPYSVRILPAHAESGFTLRSQRSRATLEFSPLYAGEVTVEVQQLDGFEYLDVKVRKASTGEILAEARGRGKLVLQGAIAGAQLKDDRRFEVVVTPAEGARGSRGMIQASFPARAVYRRTNP